MREAQSVHPKIITQHKTQSKERDTWQNTEVWGVYTPNFINLVSVLNHNNENTDGNGMEERFARVCKDKKCYVLPPLANVAQYKRSIGDFLESL